jgi:segregation and condensation protein A
MASSYFLKLNQYEGPLDLLLNLIKDNEIDIFNIDIFLLTNQYLEYLRHIHFKDLQDAGEFLEMAATLIEIKSRALLPIEERQKSDDDLEEEDPLKSLQQRLIQYERFRAVADHFALMPQLGVEIHTNQEWQRLEPEYADLEVPIKGDAATLIVLYENLLRHLPERRAVKVEAKMHAISVEEKVDELTELLSRLNFALFQGFYKKFASRYELVVYLLAVLEMTRWKKLKVYQHDALGPLWLYRMGFDEANLPLTREEKSRLLENVHLPEETPINESVESMS